MSKLQREQKAQHFLGILRNSCIESAEHTCIYMYIYIYTYMYVICTQLELSVKHVFQYPLLCKVSHMMSGHFVQGQSHYRDWTCLIIIKVNHPYNPAQPTYVSGVLLWSPMELASRLFFSRYHWLHAQEYTHLTVEGTALQTIHI